MNVFKMKSIKIKDLKINKSQKNCIKCFSCFPAFHVTITCANVLFNYSNIDLKSWAVFKCKIVKNISIICQMGLSDRKVWRDQDCEMLY